MKQADMEELSSKKMKKKHGKSKHPSYEERRSDGAGTGLDGAKLVDLLRDALAENGRLRSMLDGAEEERTSLEDELAEAQSGKQAAEKKLDELQDEKDGLEWRLRHLSDEKHVLEERLAQAQMDCDGAKVELKKAQAAIEAGQARTEREGEGDKNRLLELERELEAARQQVAGLKDEAEHAKAKSALLEKALAEAQDNLTSAQVELERLRPETQQKALADRIAALEADQRLLAKTLQDQGNATKELIRTRDELAAASRGKEKAEASARELVRELGQAKEALQKAQRELAGRQAALQDSGVPAEAPRKVPEAAVAAKDDLGDAAQPSMPDGPASLGEPEKMPDKVSASAAKTPKKAEAEAGKSADAGEDAAAGKALHPEKPAQDGSLSCGVTFAGSPLRHSRTVAPYHFPEKRKR